MPKTLSQSKRPIQSKSPIRFRALFGALCWTTFAAGALLGTPQASAEETPADTRIAAVSPPALHTATYDIYMGGLTLGKAEVNIRVDEDGEYSMSGLVATAGAARLFVDRQYALSAFGRLDQHKMHPSKSVREELTYEAEDDTLRSMTLLFDESGVPVLETEPAMTTLAVNDLPEWMQPTNISEKRLRGVRDPVSVVLHLVRAPVGETGNPCRGSVPVYDGFRLVELRLSAQMGKKTPPQQGVVRCKAAWVPQAGYRAERLKKMARLPKTADVWFRPVHPATTRHSALWIPERISVRSTLGSVVIQARPMEPTAEQPVIRQSYWQTEQN